MAKTLADYLGNDSSSNGLSVIFNINDLREIIESGHPLGENNEDADYIIALLIVALHKTTQPPTDADNVPLIDNTQAVVAVNPISPAVSVVRDGSKQVEHKFEKSVYTSDYKTFPIDRIV